MSADDYSGQRIEAAYTPLKANADAWIQLPEPPETFIAADVPDCVHAAFRQLLETQAIQKVRRVQREYIDAGYECDGSSWVWEYQWHERAWQTIEQQVETQYSPCPCDHSGVQNHGDYYSCSYDGCSQRFSREQLEVSQ